MPIGSREINANARSAVYVEVCSLAVTMCVNTTYSLNLMARSVAICHVTDSYCCTLVMIMRRVSLGLPLCLIPSGDRVKACLCSLLLYRVVRCIANVVFL